MWIYMYVYMKSWRSQALIVQGSSAFFLAYQFPCIALSCTCSTVRVCVYTHVHLYMYSTCTNVCTCEFVCTCMSLCIHTCTWCVRHVGDRGRGSCSGDSTTSSKLGMLPAERVMWVRGGRQWGREGEGCHRGQTQRFDGGDWTNEGKPQCRTLRVRTCTVCVYIHVHVQNVHVYTYNVWHIHCTCTCAVQRTMTLLNERCSRKHLH